MSKAAPRSSLTALHAKFAEYLSQVLDDAMRPVERDEDGNIIGGGIPLDAATMGIFLKFLKDNDITCEPEDLATLDSLREKYAAASRSKNLANILQEATGGEMLN